MEANQVRLLAEAYSQVYEEPQVLEEDLIWEDYLWEEVLTEEFVKNAYFVVAEHLVSVGMAESVEDAEIIMSAMNENWIDEILVAEELLSPEILEEGWFGDAANKLIGGAKKVARAGASAVRKGAGAVDRGVSAAAKGAKAVRDTAVGTVKRAASAAGNVAKRVATPVAKAVKSAAKTAVAAGRAGAKKVASAGRTAVGYVKGGVKNVKAGVSATGKALDTVGKTAYRGAKAVKDTAVGTAKRVGKSVGNELAYSRKVGAGTAK